MDKRTWLSVDWDFFVRSLGMWDWSHKEAPFFMGGFMWETRLSPFLMQGYDLVGEMDPQKWSRPRPQDFWNVLAEAGYGFDDLDFFVVADSHAAAGPVFSEVADRLGGPADVLVNFDAHHDLGYCEWERIEMMIEKGECTCDMWLGALMMWMPELESRVVYPNWMKEESDLEAQWRHIREHVPKSVSDRIELGWFWDNGQVSNTVIEPDEYLNVEALFVCRSSAWTPPWLDQPFLQFLDGFEEHSYVEPFSHDAAYDRPVDALKPREDFSMKRAKKMAETMNLMREGKIPAGITFHPEDEED
jgi:hypothetical protein